jgi:hypothetical protein
MEKTKSDQEEWRPVVGQEGNYEVSILGRVRSIPRVIIMKNGITRTVKGGIRNHRFGVHGYPMIFFSGHGRGKTNGGTVHVMVARAFLGRCPPGMEVRHGDSNKANPRLDNLSYSTHKDNHSDRLANGTNNGGETNKAAKITEQQAEQILALGQAFPGITLATQYGISKAQVRRILTGNNWKYLDRSLL